GSDIWIGKLTSGLALVGSITVDGSANSFDRGYDIKTDGAGNIYVIGALSVTSQGTNIWIAKYDSSLTQLFAATVDGGIGGNDFGYGIAIDGSGDVYATGSIDVGTPNLTDMWIAKYNSSLVLDRSISLNHFVRRGDSFGSDVATDPSGNVYVTGQVFLKYSDPEVWIAKYDSSMVLQSSRTTKAPGGEFYDVFSGGIATDASGNVYLVGMAQEDVGDNNIWIAKYDPSLVPISSVTFNGSAAQSYDEGRGVAVDAAGNIYVVGTVQETSGGYNIWVGKYSSSLSLQSEATLDSGPEDWGYGIAIDDSGNVYITGCNTYPYNLLVAKYTSALVLQSSTTINSNGSCGQSVVANNGFLYVAGYVPAPGPSTDIWIGKFNPSLALLSSNTVIGPANGYDMPGKIAAGPGGNIYITGGISGTGGGRDLWAAKYSSSLVLKSSMTINGLAGKNDTGSGIAADGAGNVYVTGEIRDIG
ncbi:MAG: SBBP repeat-containing protein, partial [Armatimonadota bacterium]|nr:SBBP repeat-containing protein [Armatimonadota bacterium]